MRREIRKPAPRRSDKDLPARDRDSLTHFLDALLPGDRLARSLPSAGVGSRTLTVDRQTLAVPQATVATDVAKPRDGLLHLAAKLPFDHVLAIEQRGQFGEFVFRSGLVNACQG